MARLRSPPAALLAALVATALLATAAPAAAASEPRLHLKHASDIVRNALKYLHINAERYEQDLAALVGFPTVSALQKHQADILAAAEWLVKRMQAAGLQNVSVIPTQGPRPVVYGEWLAAGAGRPTVLVYGHYDVQPVDPLGEWLSDPFKVDKRDGYFYGRGVDDDKGGLLQPLQALEALLAVTGTLPLNVKVMLEGEEEIMSPHLEPFLEAHAPLLAADVALSADGGQPAADQGGVSLGLRGVVSLQLDVTTAATDMHSGMKGGSVPNPGATLARLVAGLHDPATHRVAVPGFYDGVSEPGPQDQADMEAFQYDEAAEMAALGVKQPVGEQGYSTLARRWFRPTLEVVGMASGFTGEGIKTVIPRSAFAKLSARIVPGQTPDAVYDKVRAHLLASCPPYANCTVSRLGGGAHPWTNPRSTPGNAAASRVLARVMPRPPKFLRDGATIPALASFQQKLGLQATKFGWGLGDKIHAPNERLRVDMYEKGRAAWAQLFWELGNDWDALSAAASAASAAAAAAPNGTAQGSGAGSAGMAGAAAASGPGVAGRESQRDEL